MPRDLEEFRVQEQKTAPPPVSDEALHRLAARRFYREAPPYRVQFENNGTVTLRQKTYEYWENRAPEEATTWIVLSTHDDLEEAERRLRVICGPSLYYDANGRQIRPPCRTKPRWPMPPPDDE